MPTPFRKEVERLLRDGVLRLTVSSPILAQGLNLSATCILFHGLARNRAEKAGRVGRDRVVGVSPLSRIRCNSRRM
jgi:replicative superfamily II helicase